MRQGAPESKIWPDVLALAALAGLSVLPFALRAAQGMTALDAPLAHDIGFQWVPFQALIGQRLAAGYFPLWSTEVFAGFPFAAFSHGGTFYPLGFLLRLSDYARAVNWFYPVHLTVAGFGVYALGRRLSLGPLAAGLAAASYVFSGKPYYFIHFLPSTCSNVWTPWFLYGAVGLLLGRGAAAFAIVAVSFGLQILGGDVESTSYGLLLSGLFLLALGRRKEVRLARSPLIVAAMIGGGLLAAIQLAPLAELSSRFIRDQGVTFGYFSQRRFPLSMFWELVFPIKGSGQAGDGRAAVPCFYLGALTLALAGYAALAGARRETRPLGAIALFALAWSFGSLPFLDRLQYLLPGLNRFGSPEHAYYMGQLFIALLAGQGFTRLAGGGVRDAVRPVGGALTVYLLVRVGFEAADDRLCFGALPLLVLTGGYFIFLIARRGRGAAPAAAAFVICFQAVDLLAPAIAFLPKHDVKAYEYHPWLREAARAIAETDSRSIMVSELGPSDPGLFYQAGMALGMDSIDGWITTPLRDYAEVLALADPRAARFEDGKLDHLGINSDLRDGRFLQARAMPLLDLIALRFIIDRGMALKFSSPVALDLTRPDFYRRELPGPDVPPRAVIPGPPFLDPRQSKAGGWAFPVNAVARTRMFVSDGDELELELACGPPPRAPAGPDPAGPDPAPAADYALELRLSTDAGTKELATIAHGARCPGSPPSDAAPAPGPLRFDLAEARGQTVTLELLSRGPRAAQDRYFRIKAAVVNPTKPIQLRALLPGSGDVKIFENQEALPKAFVVHEWARFDDDVAELGWMKAASRDELGRKVALGREPTPAWAPGREVAPSGEREGARRLSRGPDEATYEVVAGAGGLLFVSDQYYPGWRAWVRGLEAPILRADHAFRAVPVPAGASVVRFAYQPASFRIGLWLSLSGLAALAAAALGYRRRGGRRAVSTSG